MTTNRIFHDKSVVVTGGAKGIGLAIVKTYLKSGATVVVADILEEHGKRLEKELSGEGRVLYMTCDISNPEEVRDMIAKTHEKTGRIDILINNAGISIPSATIQLSVEEWDKVINTNLRGAFLCAREAAVFMKNNGGAIVNIASTRAFMSEPGWEAYAASKGGLVALTHALALSFSEYRIRVNCISPGWIMTGDYQELRDADHLQHPSRRVGKPEDIARACLFLTDPSNDFITGENLVVDGGMTRKMIYEE